MEEIRNEELEEKMEAAEAASDPVEEDVPKMSIQVDVKKKGFSPKKLLGAGAALAVVGGIFAAIHVLKGKQQAEEDFDDEDDFEEDLVDEDINNEPDVIEQAEAAPEETKGEVNEEPEKESEEK